MVNKKNKKIFLARRADVKDLSDILRLNLNLFKKEYNEYDKTLNLEWTYSHGEKYFKRRITEKKGFVEVAEVKGKIVGYICGGIYKRSFNRVKAKYAELENMIIEGDFRNSGAGTRLAQDFINWCKENKVGYISVTASAKNNQAIGFYKKLGFADVNLTLEKAIEPKK